MSTRSWSRELKYSLVLTAVIVFGAGCGVRQFGAAIEENKTQSRLVKGYGPFYSSGQNGEDLVSKGCSSQSGRPCISARASVGMPFGFDTNSRSAAGPIGEEPIVGKYATKAGAGKTKAEQGMPRVENRDLHIMGKQVADGEFKF